MMSIPIRSHQIRRFLPIIIMIIWLSLLMPSARAANTLTVTNATDSDGGPADVTLRYAITKAQSGDTINFADSVAGQCYYTDDNSDPRNSSTRLVYTDPILVSQTKTIKAVNYNNSTGWSAVTTASITISGASNGTMPTIFPNGGIFAKNTTQTVTITSNYEPIGDGLSGRLYYTTDGTDPKASNTRIAYNGPFTVSSDHPVTIKAATLVFFYDGISALPSSDVASATFYFQDVTSNQAPLIPLAGGSFPTPQQVYIFGRAGTIPLSSPLPAINYKDLTIQGPGADLLAIDGNYQYRVFELCGSNVSISNLTVANGRAVGAGGTNGDDGVGGGGGGGGAAGGGGGLLIKNDNALVYMKTVLVDGVIFRNCRAIGGNGGNGGNGWRMSGTGAGGNGGKSELHVQSVGGTGNSATYLGSLAPGYYYGGGGGGFGRNDTSLTNDISIGGEGSGDKEGTHGSAASNNYHNTTNGTLAGNGGTGGYYGGNANGAYGGNGGNGGDGYGGAICMIYGSLYVTNCSFINNSAVGGNGGLPGESNYALGDFHDFYWGCGGNGGNGCGGAIYLGQFVNQLCNVTITGTTFSGSTTRGGAGGAGPGYFNGAYIGAYGEGGPEDLCSYGLGFQAKYPGTVINVRNLTGLSRYNVNTVLAPMPYAANCFVRSSTYDTVTADGVSVLTIKVNIRDSNNFPMLGEKVTLSQGGGHSLISPASATTNSDGEVVFTITNTKAETVTYTATDISAGLTLTDSGTIPPMTPQITFIPGPVSATQSIVTASPANVSANGIDTSTITVTLKDACGNLVGSYKTVTLSQGSGHSIISPASATTDSTSKVSFTVKNNAAEPVTYTATAGGVTITPTATVNFSQYLWIVNTLSNDYAYTPGTLRHAITNAPAGTTITFQSGLSGTLLLSGPLPAINKNLSIDGSGATVTISGDDSYRVFQIDSGTVSIKNLTIANGNVTGAIGAAGVQSATWGYGYSGDPGNSVSGGGLQITNGTVTIDNIVFTGNKATGGNGGKGADGKGSGDYGGDAGHGGNGGCGYGGAIYLTNGSLTISNSIFTGNSAAGHWGGNGGNGYHIGGNGGDAGNGFGGAIFLNSGSLTITNSQFSNNTAIGGNGGYGGSGGSSPSVGEHGGKGGNGYGGGIFINSGTLTITNIQFSNDNTIAGNGGSGINGNGNNGNIAGCDIYNSNGTTNISNVNFDQEIRSYYNSAPSDAAKSTVTVSQSGVASDGITSSAITVTLRYSNGNPVPGKTVVLNQGNTSSNISPASVTTDLSGTVNFTVTDSHTENVIYTAVDTTDNVTVNQTATVSFLPPDVGQSTVIANPSAIWADGNDQSTITVTLKHVNGNPVVGRVVTLSPGGGNSIISSANATTDSNGKATFSVTDITPEDVTYTAKDTTDNVTVTQAAMVTFKTCAWKVNSLNDDGKFGTLRYAMQNAPSGSTITFLKGLTGTLSLSGMLPVINKDLIIDGSGANVTISGNNLCRVFEVDGGTVSFKNLTVANGRIAGNGGGLLLMNGTMTIDSVTFTNNMVIGPSGYTPPYYPWGDAGIGGNGNGGAIFIDAGSLTITNSKFNGNNSTGGNGGNSRSYGYGGTGGEGCGGAIFVNGGSSVITNSQFSGDSAIGGLGGTSYDRPGGNGGNGKGGGIFVKSGSLTITNSQFFGESVIAGNGNTSQYYSNGSPGSAFAKDLYNQNGAITLSNVSFDSGNDVYFNASPADAVQSTTTVNPPGVLSDGTASATITVNLMYANGGTVPGKTVVLKPGSGSSRISPASAITGINGTVTFTVTDPIAETVTYTAADTTDNVTVTKTVTVFFLPPNNQQSTVKANPSSVVSDGAKSSTITVTLKDASGNPVKGKTVTLGQGSGRSTITALNNGLTDSNGIATFTVTDTYVETVTYTAKDVTDNMTMTETAPVTFLPPDVGKSTVIANPASVTADGAASSTIKVTLKYYDGNPVKGRIVTLSPDSGSSHITVVNNGLTDSNGTATFTVTDLYAEIVTYTATDTTDNVTVTQTATVAFLPPDSGKSTVIANPASIPADGATCSTITVTLKDANGNPVKDRTVTLSQGGGSSTITVVNNGLTDSSGITTFTVSNLKAETVTYTATDTTENVTVTQTAQVTFTTYAWTVNTLSDGDSLGTLRYAIQNAPAGNTITFQNGLNGILGLTSQLPVINKNLTIDGSGADVTISGNKLYRIFEVDDGIVSIKNITIADGKTTGSNGQKQNLSNLNGGNGNGGGLLIINGNVLIDHVSFNNNNAFGGAGGDYVSGTAGTGGNGCGGAIYVNAGSLTINNCQFNGNNSSGGNGGNGGLICYPYPYRGDGGSGGNGYGGAIYIKTGSLAINNSRFSGDGVAGGGGGTSIYLVWVNGYQEARWGSNGSSGGADGRDLYILNGAVTYSDVTFDPGTNSIYNSAALYTVTFDSQGGSPVPTVYCGSGLRISVPSVPTRSGYILGGWYKESSCANAWNFSTDTVTGNITIYAKWTPTAVTPLKPGDGDSSTSPNRLLTAQCYENDLSVQYNSAALRLGMGKNGKNSDLWLYYPNLIGKGDSQIQPGSNVLQAKLVLTVKDSSGNTNKPYKFKIYRITDPDRKGVPYFGVDGVRNGLDFQFRDHRLGMKIPWSGTMGDDIRSILNDDKNNSNYNLEDTFELVPAVCKAKGYNTIELDVSTSIRKWAEVNGTESNQGWFMTVDTDSQWYKGDQLVFYGATESDPNKRPHLEVTYFNNTANFQPPTAVSDLKATPANGQVALRWTDTGGDWIRVVRKEGMVPGGPQDGSLVSENNYNHTGLTDGSLNNGTIYYYAVFRYDLSRGYSRRSWIKATPYSGGVAPTPPTGLKVTSSGDQITLSWNNAGVTNTDWLIIEKGPSKTGPWDKLVYMAKDQNQYTLELTDPNLGFIPGTQYYFQVEAVNSNQNNNVKASDSAGPITVPNFLQAPTELTWEIISAGRVNLSWKENASGESGYRVDICQNDTNHTVLWSLTFAADTGSCSVTGLSPGAEYLIKVVAVRSGEEAAAWTEVIKTSADFKEGLL